MHTPHQEPSGCEAIALTTAPPIFFLACLFNCTISHWVAAFELAVLKVPFCWQVKEYELRDTVKRLYFVV